MTPIVKRNLLPYEEVMEWARDELKHGNRIKASHIQKSAEKMKEKHEKAEEERLRKSYQF